MGGSKGGSADPSGMYAALASAQAAQESYQIGEDQLSWAKQVWGQEQPYVQQIMQGDVTSQQQANQFASSQEALYQQTYQPLQQEFAGQAEQWASPGQQTINAGAAMTNQAQAGEAQRNSATEQLESYGINPGSTRFAGLDIASRTQQAAAEAGAGTSAVQQTKLQGLGLESQAVGMGQGLPTNVGSLFNTGTGAGAAGSTASQSNVSTGSSALTAPANWFNTGAANMNVYTNAVNSYNQAQLGYAQLGAMQSMGMGSMLGGILGMLEKGGSVEKFQAGGPAGNPGGVTRTPGVTANSPTAIPSEGTPGGYVPESASPSAGQQVDDVPARLTSGEFVIPKDVVNWEGQKTLYNFIDKARQGKQTASQRTDIGGQRATAQPAIPTFTSMRPNITPIPSIHARAA